jgi:hypothetical protein
LIFFPPKMYACPVWEVAPPGDDFYLTFGRHKKTSSEACAIKI